jgi:putative addiction module component (TIGR02574 family)
MGHMDSVILTREALKLTAFERAQLIDVLWRSLDPAEQETIDKAWLTESRSRLDAFHAGALIPVDADAALKDIEDELRR